MTASDKATVKELKRQYGGKLKGKWLNVADYMLLVECDKYQTGNVLGVKLRKDDDVTTCDYAILDDEHVFCDLDGNSLAHEVELVYCVRFPKASKCRLHVEEKSGSVNTNKWIPVDDYVKLYENDVNTRNMSILAQIHRDGISIIHCVYERGAFRDIYTERLGIRPKYVCIIDIPNVKDIYYAALKTDDDDDDYVYGAMTFFASRLESEMLFYARFDEAYRIIKSPTASLSLAVDVGKFVVGAMQPFKWADEYKGGKNKDKNKLGVSFGKLIPLWKQYSAITALPEDSKTMRTNELFRDFLGVDKK